MVWGYGENGENGEGCFLEDVMISLFRNIELCLGMIFYFEFRRVWNVFANYLVFRDDSLLYLDDTELSVFCFGIIILELPLFIFDCFLYTCPIFFFDLLLLPPYPLNIFFIAKFFISSLLICSTSLFIYF